MYMQRLLAWFLLWCATVAQAAPQQITVVYHATRKGLPFANVSETFSQRDGRYQIESVTEGIGVYALFGKRVLKSSGEVVAQGLRPLQFEQIQGDNASKTVKANFDWAAGTLSMQYKGKTKTEPLQPGTQDLLSYAYQFIFQPPRGEEVVMPVTTGRRLREYRYRIAERDVVVDSVAGSYKAIHLIEAESGEDSKELWLGSQQHHIPVRIIMKDENGTVTEQTLTSLHVE
jgi:hypothetical protein